MTERTHLNSLQDHLISPDGSINLTQPHPADPLVTYTPPLKNGKPDHDFPLNEEGVSPYSGLPPVYYNGVLISSQGGNSWDGYVGVNSGILAEPLEMWPGSYIVPDTLIGGISETVAGFFQSMGGSAGDTPVFSDQEHTNRMNAVIDKMPKRSPEEVQAHVYRVAYEQITGTHKQEAAKRNEAAGITAPGTASQQDALGAITNMIRAVTNAGNTVNPDAAIQPSEGVASLPPVSTREAMAR